MPKDRLKPRIQHNTALGEKTFQLLGVVGRGAIYVRRAANVHRVAWMRENVFRGIAALRLAIGTASLRDRGSPADTLPASIFLGNPARISPGMP